MAETIDGSRMLVRDFVHNSLYHPTYGYFSKNARVLSPQKPFKFNEIKDNNQFLSIIQSKLYNDGGGQQIWHTPTELFQPHYGNAIARYITKQFKQNPNPTLDIYEIGAGNGTLAKNILDFLRSSEPLLYRQCNYKIIEISEQLSMKQKNALKSHRNVEITNKSIFQWDTPVQNDCFVIGLEVLVLNV